MKGLQASGVIFLCLASSVLTGPVAYRTCQAGCVAVVMAFLSYPGHPACLDSCRSTRTTTISARLLLSWPTQTEDANAVILQTEPKPIPMAIAHRRTAHASERKLR